MTEVVIWHNPRCSKSREALKLIEGRGITPVIRRYLDDAPNLAELRVARDTLGLRAVEMMRPKETLFSQLGLSKADDEETLLAAMADHPRLIERPIVFANGLAALGRPPERVPEIL